MKRILVIGLAMATWGALIAILTLVLLEGASTKTITEPESPTLAPTPTSALVTVYQTPECDCCADYVAYLKNEGFQVEVVYVEDMDSIWTEYQISPSMRSCHTAVVNGYFVEGHMPVEELEKLLEERPAIAGIALPGMPSGAPGMPGLKTEEFKIYAIPKTQIVEDVTPEEAYALIQDNKDNQNFVIIDVRTPEEYARGYIEEAINLDYYSETFRDKLNRLDKNKTYLIYCQSGRRSGMALNLMEELGFREVYNMLGGFAQWESGGLPTVK